MPDADGRYTWGELSRHVTEWKARGLPGRAILCYDGDPGDLPDDWWERNGRNPDGADLPDPGNHICAPFPDPTGPQIVAHIEQWIAAGHGTEHSPAEDLPVEFRWGSNDWRRQANDLTAFRRLGDQINSRNYRLVTFDRNSTPTPSKEEPMITPLDLKARVATYLASGTHERQDALRRLASRDYGFFIAADPEEVLTRFLADNPSGACDDGIRRFREAVDFPEPPKVPEKAILRIVLDVEITDPSDYFARRPTTDGGTVSRVLNAVQDADGIGRVNWLGYEARRGGVLQTDGRPTGWPFDGEKTGAAR